MIVSSSPSAVDATDRRQEWADQLLDRLTPVMSALAVLFVLVVFGESMTDPDSTLGVVLTIVGWVLWSVFVVEFLARIVVAPDSWAFLKRNWWQVAFLVLPVLRIFRLIRVVRFLRTGRVLSSAIRSTRSAHRLLGGRIGWLAVVSAITILASSQLLFEFGVYDTYGDALHSAAMGAITGEPLGSSEAFARVLEVVLAIFSVVVFATLAGTLGAYFLEVRGWRGAEPPAPDTVGERPRLEN
jgi:voltage-gated potassium channel